jgi:peptidoglycan/LPS O-acetylase OafA/YrhL
LENQKRLPYKPQLDSFRFVAVFLVIISHWIEGSPINKIPNGFLGVTFFFVLSGFLISTNLLYYKQSINNGELSITGALGKFYYRRTLRIFPLYFLVIALLYLGNKSIFQGNVSWYLWYVPNFLIFKVQQWPGMLSHFWSLGVEEQFYLLWPLLILVFPWRYLKYLFPGIIILSVLAKFFFYFQSTSFFTFYDVLPISCFDAFGIGAVLALYSVEKGSYELVPGKIIKWLLPTLVVFCIVIFNLNLPFLFGVGIAAVSGLVVLKACKGVQGWIGKILNLPIIIYLGKISYGLYVYHNFMPWLLRCLNGTEVTLRLPVPSFNMPWTQKPYIALITEFILLVVIASISWRFFEKPINNLKKYSG